MVEVLHLHFAGGRGNPVNPTTPTPQGEGESNELQHLHSKGGRETGKPNESETLFTTGGLNGPYYLYTTGESDSTASTTSIRFTDRGR